MLKNIDFWEFHGNFQFLTIFPLYCLSPLINKITQYKKTFVLWYLAKMEPENMFNTMQVLSMAAKNVYFGTTLG